MITLDTKTAVHTLTGIAKKVSDELDAYRGWKGMTKELDDAIGALRKLVDELEYLSAEALSETHQEEQ